jgi:hypothetical protein
MLARAIVALCPKASLEAATDMASYLEMLAEEGVDADDIVSALEAQLDGQGLAASSAAMESLARQLLAGAFKGKGEAAAPAVASTPALLKEAIVCAPAAPSRATVAAASSTSSTSSPTSAAASSSATSATTTATTSGAGAPTKGDDKASLASVVRTCQVVCCDLEVVRDWEQASRLLWPIAASAVATGPLCVLPHAPAGCCGVAGAGWL